MLSRRLRACRAEVPWSARHLYVRQGVGAFRAGVAPRALGALRRVCDADAVGVGAGRAGILAGEASLGRAVVAWGAEETVLVSGRPVVGAGLASRTLSAGATGAGGVVGAGLARLRHHTNLLLHGLVNSLLNYACDSLVAAGVASRARCAFRGALERECSREGSSWALLVVECLDLSIGASRAVVANRALQRYHSADRAICASGALCALGIRLGIEDV